MSAVCYLVWLFKLFCGLTLYILFNVHRFHRLHAKTLHNIPMPCIICLNEEMPGDVNPCKTCFGIEFHETCLQEYKRTKQVCPTCKTPFEAEEQPQLERTSEGEHVIRRIQEDTHVILTDAYRSAVFFQLMLMIVTVAFVPRKEKMTFASLLVTMLALVWAHVFERVDRLMVIFRVLAAMGWSLTAVNTGMYDQSALMVTYVCLSCVNALVYVVRHSTSTNVVSVQPE